MNIQNHYCESEFDEIHDYLSNQAYWSKGISKAILAQAMANSLCFVVKNEDGELLAFARVVSDFATFANLLDVFVLPSHRGNGIAKALMAHIVNHPQLQGLRRFTLATKDAHGLYAQFGFTAALFPAGNMEVYRPNMYSAP